VSVGAGIRLADGQTALPVILDNGAGMAGFQASFGFDPAIMTIGTPQLAEGASGLLLDSHVKDGLLQIVMLSVTPAGFSSDMPALVYIPYSLRGEENATLTLAGLRVSDRFARSASVENTATSWTVSARETALPTAFALHGARPNPFNPSATIAYEVPQQARVTFAVYNLLGQEVVTLVNEVKAPGRYTVTWTGRNTGGLAVASGVYLYRLTSGSGYTETRRMTLLK
jgi:hypothetical protein